MHPSDTGRAGWDSLAMGCVFTLVSVFWSACSGFHMFTETFPEMAGYGGEQIPARAIFALLTVMTLLFTLPGRRFLLCRKLLAGLTPFLVGLAVWRVWAVQGKELSQGCLRAAGIVIAAVNHQYKFNFPVPEGQAGDSLWAMVYIGAVLLSLLLYGAFLFRRRWIVMGLPLLALALGLLAGRGPGLRGITEGFIGLLFCRAGGWEGARAPWGMSEKGARGVDSWIARGVTLTLLVLLAAFLPAEISGRFGERAQRLASSGEGVVALQRSLEEIVELNIQQLSFGSENAVMENINNRTPKYREQEILQVTLADKPENALYFRSFYGGEYARGGWNSNRRALLQSLAGQGWAEEDMARWLSGRWIVWQNGAGAVENFPESCTLRYLRRSGTVYMPYFLLPEDPGGELRYGGEYAVMKKKSLDSVHFSRNTEEPAAGMEEEGSRMDQWYSAYVQEHYLYGSSSVPSAARIAKELLEQYSGTYSMVPEKLLAGNTPYGGSQDLMLTFSFSEALASSDARVRDRARMQFARLVSSYLSSGRYSQELDRVPDGTDVVEYFLAESQTGYCVHYASAGVLILQALGIPARYASGYIAEASDFGHGAGGYTLALKDSAAHAWAEIYLENGGWVPVEMTPGYGNGQRAVLRDEATILGVGPVFGKTSDDSGNTEPWQNREPQVTTEEEEGSASPDGVETPGHTAVSSSRELPETSRTPQPSGRSGASGTAGREAGVKETGAAGNGGWAQLLAFVLVGGISAVLIFLLYCRNTKKRRRLYLLLRDIRLKRNCEAVLRMNRSMYRRVRAKNRRWFARMADSDYRQLLVQTFPEITEEEWERFMAIAQKAGFSQSAISDEEVQEMYGIFQR